MADRRTTVVAGLAAVLAAAGVARVLAPGVPEPAPRVAAPPRCPDPVAVAWPGAQERLGCLGGLGALLAEAARAAGCEARAPAGVLPGDRVTVAPGEGGRCRTTVEPLPGASLVALGLPVDVNRAREEDLRVLPGIGPSRARAIVAYREARGPFESLSALARVKGIGPATVAALEGRAVAGRSSGSAGDASEGAGEAGP